MRLPIRSKNDGTFLTLLPKIAGDTWPRIEIESTNPHITRALTDVKLSGVDGPEAFVDIQLASTSIEGMVVEESGVPARNALVNVVAPGGDFKQLESSDGTFSVTGLAPGHYKLTATTREMESDAIEIDVSEASMKQITLVVEPVSRFRGTIRSSFGAVMSAGVFITPAGVDPPVISPIPVNAEGRFDVRLPPRTSEVVIAAAAPGFSFRMLRMPVPRDGDADIAVDQQGGALVVESDGSPAFIVHNGATLAVNVLAYLAGARRINQNSFEVPQIEAGTYNLCASADRCVSGTLARGGRLVLTSSRAKEQSIRGSTAASF